MRFCQSNSIQVFDIKNVQSTSCGLHRLFTFKPANNMTYLLCFEAWPLLYAGRVRHLPLMCAVSVLFQQECFPESHEIVGVFHVPDSGNRFLFLLLGRFILSQHFCLRSVLIV